MTGSPSLETPTGAGKGDCVQLNDPAGIATAVPIIGPGNCAFTSKPINKISHNMCFIMINLL